MEIELTGWEHERRRLEEENQRLRYDLAMVRQDLASLQADRTPIRLVDGETGQPLNVVRPDPPHRTVATPVGDRGRRLATLIHEKHQARRERDLALAEVRRLQADLDTATARILTTESHLADLLRLGDDHS